MIITPTTTFTNILAEKAPTVGEHPISTVQEISFASDESFKIASVGKSACKGREYRTRIGSAHDNKPESTICANLRANDYQGMMEEGFIHGTSHSTLSTRRKECDEPKLSKWMWIALVIVIFSILAVVAALVGINIRRSLNNPHT